MDSRTLLMSFVLFQERWERACLFSTLLFKDMTRKQPSMKQKEGPKPPISLVPRSQTLSAQNWEKVLLLFRVLSLPNPVTGGYQ